MGGEHHSPDSPDSPIAAHGPMMNRVLKFVGQKSKEIPRPRCQYRRHTIGDKKGQEKKKACRVSGMMFIISLQNCG